MEKCWKDKTVQIDFCSRVNAAETILVETKKVEGNSDLQYLECFKCYLGFQYAYNGKFVRGNSFFQYNGLFEMNNLSKRLIETILRILNSKIYCTYRVLQKS